MLRQMPHARPVAKRSGNRFSNTASFGTYSSNSEQRNQWFRDKVIDRNNVDTKRRDKFKAPGMCARV